MGNAATKFRKALINGDEVLACQLYESNQQFKEALDPNSTYGVSYQHNTPLHYAARHAMTRLLRSGCGRNKTKQTSKQTACAHSECIFLDWSLSDQGSGYLSVANLL